LLTPDNEIIDIGAFILKIEAFCEPFYGASLVANGALRGTGDTLIPSIFKFGSVWFIRIPLAVILVKNFGLNGIWFAMSFELCVRGILFLIRLAGKKWLKK
jgi:Na+-driven multidrug efflux pump